MLNHEPPPPTVTQKIVVGFGVIVPFVGCILAIVLMGWLGWMSWTYLGLLVGGWLVSGLGITIGFHRLLSHRSFETYRWIRAGWAALGAVAAQGPPLTWSATHRKHHKLSDQPGDPHSPHQHGDGLWNAIKGLFHAHLGWIFTHGCAATMVKRYVPDLCKDWLLVVIERSYAVWILIGLLIPAGVGWLVTGGWQGFLLGLLWGGLVRIFLVHHVTWSINSVCHTFGRRTYACGDRSSNNFIFGLLGHGEGWHNNHHAFPTSARHGLHWWQVDVSWLVIRTMQFLRLAWHVRTPARSVVRTHRLERRP